MYQIRSTILLFLLHIKCTFCILKISNTQNFIDEQISKSVLEISRRSFSQSSYIFLQTPSVDSGEAQDQYSEEYLVTKLHSELGIPVIAYKYGDTTPCKAQQPHEPQALIFILPKAKLTVQFRYFRMFLRENPHEMYPQIHIVLVSPTFESSSINSFSVAGLFLNEVWTQLKEVNIIFVAPHYTFNGEFNWLEVFTWFPHLQTDVCFARIDKITINAIWVPHESNFINGSKLFPSNRIKDMRGCPMKVALIMLLPYVIPSTNNRTSNNTFHITGFIPEVLKALKKTINIKLENNIIKSNNALISSMDMIAPVYINTRNFWTMRKFLTYPYYIYSTAWYVPVFPIPKWQSIIRIFRIEMWTTIAVTYLLGSVMFWLLGETNDPVKVLLDTLRTQLCVGIRQNFRGALATIFFCLWLMFCLHINIAYQSGLIGFIAEPGVYPPIASLEELQTSGLRKESSFHSAKMTMEGRFYKYARNFKGDWPSCGLEEDCLEHMLKYQQTATLHSKLTVDIFLKYMYSKQAKRKIVSLDTTFSNNHSVMFVSMGPILVKHIDSVTSTLFSAGLMGDIAKNFELALRNVAINRFPRTETVFVLKMNHVQSAFYLLLMGHILAFIVFLLELLFKAYVEANNH